MRRCLLLPVPLDGLILLPTPLGALSLMPHATALCWGSWEEGRTLILLPGMAARATRTQSWGHGGRREQPPASGTAWGCPAWGRLPQHLGAGHGGHRTGASSTTSTKGSGRAGPIPSHSGDPVTGAGGSGQALPSAPACKRARVNTNRFGEKKGGFEQQSSVAGWERANPTPLHCRVMAAGGKPVPVTPGVAGSAQTGTLLRCSLARGQDPPRNNWVSISETGALFTSPNNILAAAFDYDK